MMKLTGPLVPVASIQMRLFWITLLSLATWWDVAEMAEKLGRFEPGQYEKVQRFLKDPESWPAARAAARR